MRTRDLEQGPRSQYSYLVRSTAKYECPFFGPDGKLRRRRVQASELGTAFAYEVSGGDTYLMTNEHVAVWPEVTDALHRIDGVADGCKRVEDKLRIVRDERDDFDPGQIALHARRGRSAAGRGDPEGAGQKLTILPYKIGKSAGLRQGNAVAVRGFPLGVMQAVSERQGRQPVRPRSGAGLGPRRLRDRRAAVGGELGQPGARGVVPFARAGAGRRVPRRLQGPRRAERRRRDRPARRVHAARSAGIPRAITAEGSPGALGPGRARPHQGRAGGGHAAAVRPRRPGRARRDRRRRAAVPLLRAPVSARRPARRRDRGSRPRRRRSASSGGCGCWGRPAGASGRPPPSARTSAIWWRGWATRSASRCCTRSTTATRWRTRARPTSAGAAATCRGPSRATCRWRAISRRTCSRPATGCRRPARN